jgi:putative inorganic carbon (hco3(-)) transporter
MERENFSGIRLDLMTLFAFMALMLPLSVKVFYPVLGSVIIFPGEILIGIIALLFLYELFVQKKHKLSKDFLLHPITLIVLSYLLINLLSGVFSTMFLVSFKALMVKISYIVVFFFLTYQITLQDQKNFLQLLRYYASGFLIVILYTIINLTQLGFTRSGAGFACHPFYNDHTIYSAAMAFLLPVFVVQTLYQQKLKIPETQWLVVLAATLALIIGFYFSFCRAAWVSMLATLLFIALIMAGLRFRGIVVTFLIAATTLFFFKDPIYRSMKANRNDSNREGADVYEHVASLTNITNDYSNKERLNRWYSSVQMFRVKPLLGFGPGTFQFQYLPFQSAQFRNYLSLEKPLRPGFGTFYWHSNAVGLLQDKDYTYRQGGGGTAHSEYFLELAESGLISMLLYAALLFACIYTGLRIYSRSTRQEEKILSLSIMAGLITYFIHSLFNNFMDDCKIAFLFWGSLAMLTAMDVKLKQGLNSQP